MTLADAMVETELEDAWVMAVHRASTGELFRGCQQIDCDMKSYVNCWLDVRDRMAVWPDAAG